MLVAVMAAAGDMIPGFTILGIHRGTVHIGITHTDGDGVAFIPAGIHLGTHPGTMAGAVAGATMADITADIILIIMDIIAGHTI